MITGIITEYNPFTNGHKYQTDTIQNRGSEYIIAVMSGDFTQRGEPALIDKYTRTKMALNNGIDLVIELPAAYATADAGKFAAGGVSILNSLGVVDTLAFGVEEGCEDYCLELSDYLLNPGEEFELILKSELKKGLSYPVARVNALSQCMNNDFSGFNGSNTILAVEYCQSLNRLNSSIKPMPITRIGKDYNDTDIADGIYSSASGIRNLLKNKQTGNPSLDMLIPGNCITDLAEALMIFPEDISLLLHYVLLINDSYTGFLDINESFSDRIRSQLVNFTDYESFCSVLKSKNITYTSVKRLLCHILLGLPNSLNNEEPAEYARVLGFRKDSAPLLNLIKKQSSIPLISKVADADKIISGPALDMLNADIKAANIYESLINNKYKTRRPNEYSHGLVML